jgi:hypothetical protein
MTSRHKIFRKQGERGAFDVSSPSIARQGLRLSLSGESASRRCSKLSVPGSSDVLHPLRGAFEANATAVFANEARNGLGLSRSFSRPPEDATRDSRPEGAPSWKAIGGFDISHAG